MKQRIKLCLAHNILSTYTDTLQVGREEKPITNTAKIIIIGETSLGNLAISDTISTTPQSLINFRDFNISL